jgi:hypothetical protein
VTHSGEDLLPEASPRAVTFFTNTVDATVVQQPVNAGKPSIYAGQEMYPIEEQDEAEEENTIDDARKKARTYSISSEEKGTDTPIKAFAKYLPSEQEELRLTSKRLKSPLKSLSNFNISSSPKDSIDKSEKAGSRVGYPQNKEVGRISPLASEASADAFARRPAHAFDSRHRSGEKDRLIW